MASSTGSNHFISREEYRARKALDEARKAGTAPAQLDEDGKEINPHMPQYIIQAPWYLNQNTPSLKHHKIRNETQKTGIDQWYLRGARQGEVNTKFRKGACENCGANTHKTKDCCERPRKVGAKFSNQDIAADEIIQNLDLDYDAKRDRWNGYDPNMYSEVVKEYEKLDEVRKVRKQEELENGKQENSESDPDSQDDEFKEKVFDNNAPVANTDPRTKTTTRNLRIREDTAKYLLNLDENSAYYDGKSRSMRENPNPFMEPEKQMFKGDNYVRLSGDTLNLLEQEKFAWDSIEKDQSDLNSIALPTATEMIFKKAQEKLKSAASEKKSKLLKEYGGQEFLETDFLPGQSERYVEYTRDGKIKPRKDTVMGKSKYEEDVFVNDHHTVWGSWWNLDLGWGYGCCHSTTKSSMCLGEKGKKIAVHKQYKIQKAKEEELKKLEEALKKEGAPVEELKPSPSADDLKNLSKELDASRPKVPAFDIPAKKEAEKNEKVPTPKKAESSSSSSSESSSGESSNSGSSSDSSSSGSDSSHESDDSESHKKSKLKEKLRHKDSSMKEKLDNKMKGQYQSHNSEDKKKRGDTKAKDKEALDRKKRKYNSVKYDNEKITEEDLEEYHKKKMKFDDPLRKM
jgi:pre-mRNA-processing factor SLU7